MSYTQKIAELTDMYFKGKLDKQQLNALTAEATHRENMRLFLHAGKPASLGKPYRVL